MKDHLENIKDQNTSRHITISLSTSRLRDVTTPFFHLTVVVNATEILHLDKIRILCTSGDPGGDKLNEATIK